MAKGKAKRGFAAMTLEQRRAIASMGGKAVPAEKRSYSANRALAAESGRKGGNAVPDEKRSYSADPELASRAGAKGGRARAARSRER